MTPITPLDIIVIILLPVVALATWNAWRRLLDLLDD